MKSPSTYNSVLTLAKANEASRSNSIEHYMNPVAEFIEKIYPLLVEPNESVVTYSHCLMEAGQYFSTVNLRLSVITADYFDSTHPNAGILTSEFHYLKKPLQSDKEHDELDLLILRVLHMVDELICSPSLQSSLMDNIEYLRTLSLVLYGLIMYLDTHEEFKLGIEDIRVYEREYDQGGFILPIMIIQSGERFFELALEYPDEQLHIESGEFHG